MAKATDTNDRARQRSGYPMPTSAAATAVMRANRGTDTVPELRLRSALHRMGLRFRKNLALKAGGRTIRPDIVFTRQRVAVFVDGCFWHGCPAHGTRPRGPNETYWRDKIDQNVARDIRQQEALRAAGWEVLRLWEHVPTDEAAEEVRRRLHARRQHEGCD